MPNLPAFSRLSSKSHGVSSMGLFQFLFGKRKAEPHPQDSIRSDRVEKLTLMADDFLAHGNCKSAEMCYNDAFAAGIRWLGLHHSTTRKVLAAHSKYLREAQRNDEAVQLEALYWKTGGPETFSSGLVSGGVEQDVQQFLEKNPDWFENLAQQLSGPVEA